MISRLRYCLIVFIMPMCFTPAMAQYGVKVETMMAAGSEGHLPKWLSANRYGKISNRNTNGYFLLGGSWHRPLIKKDSARIKDQFQAEFLARDPLSTSYFHQLSYKLSYGKLDFQVGRWEHTIGGEGSSTGSLAQSQNIRPIPKVGFTLNYWAVPGTNNLIEIKGGYHHGWLEKNRAIENPFLHEKYGFIRIGDKKKWPVTFWAGGTHFALWGGTDPGGLPLQNDLEAWYRVNFGTGQRFTEEDSLSGLYGEILNAVGSHLGTVEVGGEIKLKGQTFLWNYQKLWEDRSGLNRLDNRDGALSLSWRGKPKKLFERVSFEYVSTLFQGGPGLPDSVAGQSNFGYAYGGRDDYYNNYIYRSGWTYQDRVIGSPLMMTTQEARQLFGDVEDYGVDIFNNRLVSYSLRFSGLLRELRTKADPENPARPWSLFHFTHMSYKFLASYTRNSGTYAGLNGGRSRWGSRDPDFDNSAYPFLTVQEQWHFLLETTLKSRNFPYLTYTLAGALDTGDFGTNYGVLMGVKSDFSVWK